MCNVIKLSTEMSLYLVPATPKQCLKIILAKIILRSHIAMDFKCECIVNNSFYTFYNSSSTDTPFNC